MGLLVFLRGVSLTTQPRWRRFRFVATTLVVVVRAAAGFAVDRLVGPLCNMAFYAACWLVVYYLAAGIVKRIVRFGRGAMSKPHGAARPRSPSSVAVTAVGSRGVGRRSAAPVTVPPDAIIVPYDPAEQDP